MQKQNDRAPVDWHKETALLDAVRAQGFDDAAIKRVIATSPSPGHAKRVLADLSRKEAPPVPEEPYDRPTRMESHDEEVFTGIRSGNMPGRYTGGPNAKV